MKYLNLILPFLLVGCGFGAFNKESNEAALKDRQEIEELNRKYSPLVGTYRGTLIDGGNTYEIQIGLFTLQEERGNNPDGETNTRPVLKAAYKRLQPISETVVMSARFIAETGELILVNNKAKPDDVHTIEGALIGQRIIGTAKSLTGIIGELDLSLSARQVERPGQSEKDEFNEKLRLEYNRIAGTYLGIVQPNPQMARPFRVTVKLFIVETVEGTPELKAYYNPANADGIGEQVLVVNYSPELNPPKIKMTSAQSNTASISINAIIKDQIIEGNMILARGIDAKIKIQKQ